MSEERGYRWWLTPFEGACAWACVYRRIPWYVRSHFLALRTLSLAPDIRLQAPVVQTSDSAIHRINHYPADSVIDFRNTYPLDSDLSGG